MPAEAKLEFKAHRHVLRHACGFALASKAHDTRALQAYLGHKNIRTRSGILSFPPPGSRASGGVDPAPKHSFVLGPGEGNFDLGPTTHCSHDNRHGPMAKCQRARGHLRSFKVRARRTLDR